jgi:hypothetical protein
MEPLSTERIKVEMSRDFIALSYASQRRKIVNKRRRSVLTTRGPPTIIPLWMRVPTMPISSSPSYAMRVGKPSLDFSNPSLRIRA